MGLRSDWHKASSTLAASALQHGNVLLTRHCAGVVVVDDLNAGASVASKGDQINALPVKQPKGNGAVAQAV